MKMISLKIPSGLDAKLTALARRRNMSKSTVVREAVEQYLRDSGNGVTLSCLDLARDLAGSVTGPPDLSSNKKYLEGLGQ
jgi:hypothetical protein